MRVPSAVIANLAFLWLCLAGAASVSGDEPVEGAPVLFARELLPGEQLRTSAYRIAPMVDVVDFEYVFTIESNHGTYRARGVAELRRRLREVEVVERLGEVSQSEAFASSLSSSLADPLLTTFGVARRPFSSVTGLPSGIGRYLGGKWYQMRRGSDRAVERWRAFRNSSDEAEPEPEVEAASASGGTAQRIGKSATKLSKRHLGHDSAKRKWARRFGVDPYSDNAALQEALGRIAWASSLGEFAADFAMPASEVFSYAGKAQELVWDRPAYQLERDMENGLKKQGVSQEAIEAFLETELYSLTEKVTLRLAMQPLPNAASVELLIETLLEAESERDAALLIRTVELIAQYGEEVSPLRDVRRERGMLIAYAANGYEVLPLAADYLHWTPLLYEALFSEELAAEKREVWVSGEVSPVAAMRLRHHGWQVFDRRAGRE